VGSRKIEDRAASEAVHCWGRRMSFNTSSHKISGLRSPVLASAMTFLAIGLTPSPLSCLAFLTLLALLAVVTRAGVIHVVGTLSARRPQWPLGREARVGVL
jgi:hypothetical protein